MVTPEWLTGTESLPCKEVINDVVITFNSIFQSDMKCVLLKKKLIKIIQPFFQFSFILPILVLKSAR